VLKNDYFFLKSGELFSAAREKIKPAFLYRGKQDFSF
jgi:hypothetical protein